VAFRKYINITDQQMQAQLDDLDLHHDLYGLYGAGRVRDRLSGPAEVQAAITQAVSLYIERLPTDEIEGHKIVLHASDIIFCYDNTMPIRYSEQIVRHIRDDGTPIIENILDRPLAGFPALPANMYNKLGLCEIALHDLKDKGGCMVAQIYECARERHTINGKRTGNGVREKNTKELRKVFKDPKELEFVMRDCPIPIDIIFVDGTGRVTAAHKMTPEPPRAEDEKALSPPFNNAPKWTWTNAKYEARLKKYPSKFAAQYVIELAANSLDVLNVKPADKIEFDRAAMKKLAK
jgi:uncharacterized membrane protein (UPF0127 family)